MAGELNITVVGNISADPELKQTPSGIAYVNLSVASTPRTYDRGTGEWKDGETMWIRCTVWREVAENVQRSLTKGTRVIVTGKLKPVNVYQSNTGESRASLEIEVEEIGPSLRYATAAMTRRTREGQGAVEANPWGTQPQAPSAPASDAWSNPGTNSGFASNDETPF